MVLPTIASGDQPLPPDQGDLTPIAKAALVAGSIGASGFIPTANGRLFDHYVNAIRAVETGFPAAILRTFRTSEFLSPLESWSQIDVAPSSLQHGKYAEFLSSRFGHATSLSLKRTGSIFGQVTNEAGEILGYGLQIEAGSQKGTAIADYFARASGIQLTEFQSLNDALLRSQYRLANPGIPYAEWLESLEPQLRRQRLILGSRIRSKISILGKDLQLSKSFAAGLAKTETVFNLLRAKAASTTGRLNTLLSAPLDIPYLGGVLSKIPGLRSLSVRPGTSTQMISRFVGKGLLIGAGWKGLEYLDYLRNEGSPLAPVFSTAAGAGIGSLIARAPGMKFSKAGLLIGGAVGLLAGIAPRFDEGLFYGAATLATDLTLAKAEISEAAGLTESLQEQERVTPGLTDLSTGAAFAGVGALTAGFFSYGGLLKESILNRKSASRFADVIEITRAARKENLLKGVWESRFGRAIEDIPFLKRITKTKSPMLLGALAGFAGWQLLSSGLSILSGNPMAAVPGASLVGTTETPEELQAIYSGEKEVPIRKGRFWEFGRCLAKHTEIITFSGVSKKAEDIKIGDILVGRDHKEATVKNIFTRYHKGEILKFSCAFDRDLKVEVTGNHKIPILRKLGLDKEHRAKYKTKEVEASEIRLNDYVEIPVKKLESNITEINSLDYLVGPVFVQDKKIYSSQLNWFSRKPQRSGSHSIPTSIPLNKDIGFLFGIYLAEGNIGQKNNTPHLIEMVHSVHEKWIVEKIQLITEQYFNSKTTVRFKKTGKKTKEGCYITRVCSSILAKLFRGLFYPKDYSAEEKSIPNIFMYGHKSFKKGLIEGYYAGDGNWNKAKVINSSRKWLLEQTQQIALSIGMLSGIGPKEENGFLGRWRLRFDSGSVINPSVINYKGKIYAAIRTVETEEYDDAVYDFEVDDPDHLFRAGPFLVHNSSFEGDKIQYFRQHALPRLRARAYQKGLYGSEEERWEYSPWLNPIKALFGSDEWKYHYEQKYQQERPAPVTAPAGEEIPFVGPLVAETIGKLIKPRKLVRPEEWITDTGVIHKPTDEELEPAYGVGGLPAGQPLAPGESTQLFNELLYRRREAVGLVGFTEGALTKSLLGREEIFPNQQTLAQMGKETGGEHWLFQHLNLGGAIGSCLPAGEKVLTPGGLVNIENIEIGDSVYDNDYKVRKVLNTFVRNCNDKEKIVTLNIATGNKNIRITDNHKIATIKRIKCHDNHKRPCTAGNPKKHCQVCKLKDSKFKWEWLEAKYIEPGDFVAMPLPRENNKLRVIDLKNFVVDESFSDKYIYNSNCSENFVAALELIEENNSITRKQLREHVCDKAAKEALHSFRNNNSPKRIPRFVEITEDFAYLLGWYLAEGCCTSHKRPCEIVLTLNVNELDIATKLGKIYTKVFGYSYDIRKKKEDNAIMLRFSNPIFARFLLQFGHGAKNKELGHLINLPDNLLIKLIEGLINGDGWLNEELGRGGFTSSSNRLTRDLWLSLCKLGVFSTIVDNYLEIPNGYYPQGSKRKETLRNYLSFDKTSYKNLINLFNNKYLPKEASNGRNFKTKDFVYLPVREVRFENAENQKVYDIEVEKSHCFIGNYLLLHNSEAARRFIPRTRSYLDTYNPLSNQMPSWMPGEDYFMDFKTGNPYQLSQLPEAEIRLPGPGLASLYPALEGVDPENYPLAYRAKVLGDVAFWSNEYRQTISQAKKNLKFMSEEEQQIVLTTEEQVKAKKQRRNFKDYVFAQDQLQQETVTVTDVLSPRRFKTKEYGDTILEAKGIGAITKPQEALETTINALEGSKISIYSPDLESRRFSRVSEGPRMEVVPMLGDRDLGTVLTEAGYAKHKELEDEFRQIRFTPSERLAGSISERILHNAETPLEYLTPISPASKLIRQRSPIEEYERTEAIGTANSFWDRPVDNFLKPAYNMTKYELGSSEIPEEIQQRRDITEYFDKLEWVKASRLEAKAKLSGDFHLASEFKKQKESTVFGVDVFNSPVNVMRALPRRERDFFNEFIQAKTIKDREKILSLVPEDEKRIYLSQWARQEENSSRAKIEAKIATEDDNKALSLVAQMRKSEGFSFDEAMARRWMEETGGKIAFDDWLREQEAEEYFRTHSLPGADWIGFNPAVSLDDIRMVAVEMLGQDFHEHDLWDDRKRLLARKPYINPTVVSEMQEQSEYQDSWKVARNSKALTEMFGDYKASLYQSKVAANLGPPRYNIELRDGRQDLIDKAYERITG